jgi:hypothetical protein
MYVLWLQLCLDLNHNQAIMASEARWNPVKPRYRLPGESFRFGFGPDAIRFF